ncbi:MAG: phage holin family protein [Verrucomicrobia bacterium]|nr:phage holin family protein [Verrucomicrobiota bacterium]
MAPVTFLNFLQRWVVTTLAVLVAAWMVPGLRYDTASAVILASLMLGFLNAFVRPLLLLFSIPLLVLSLGLFVPVLNALLLMLVDKFVKGFHVAGFWPAFWGGLVISVVSIVINLMLGQGPQVQIRRGPRPPRNKDGGPGGGGPIIDV